MRYKDRRYYEELDRRVYVSANAARVNLIEEIEAAAFWAGSDGLFIPAADWETIKGRHSIELHRETKRIREGKDPACA